MAAGKYNIEIEQGADFKLPLTIKDNGVVRDLTGWSARAQIRQRPSDVSPLASFTCSIPVPADGTILMELGNAETKLLSPGTYYYDLEIYTSADAQVQRILKGKALVDPEITQ